MNFLKHFIGGQKENKPVSRIRKFTGVTLIALGILGIILPILPGWWVIVVGLEIMGWRMVIDRKKPWRDIIHIRNKEESEN